MDLLNNLGLGFQTALTLQNLAYAFFGAVLGTLIGAFIIGWLTGGKGGESVAAFMFDPFKGVLCLFLLEMGLMAVRHLGLSGALASSLSTDRKSVV